MYKNYTKTGCMPPGYIKMLLRVMKITTLLLFVAFMQVSAAGLAQKVTLVKKGVTLKEVFREINKQTGYNVFAADNLVSKVKPFDANFKDAGLLEVLNICLENTLLTYTVSDKNIVVTKKELPVNGPNVPAQTVIVTGKVTNELGEPVAGVTVKQQDNPNNGAITDVKGNYSLTVPDNNTVISFSYIGYETQELFVKNIPSGSVIILKAITTNLREVVVDKGYYKERRELSTGNVSVITAKTIEEQPVSDPIQALIGRVPGLNIQQTSGVPGAYATIHINGLNSIANGNDPLYIVDGVPFSSVSLTSTAGMTAGAINPPSGNIYNNNGGGISPFSALNPEDIESIEVLKDADATAIYGSRGANGVILITTKRGKVGPTKFTLDANQGVGQVGHFMDMMNTQQYLEMRKQSYANDGLISPSINTSPSDNKYDIDGIWDTTRYTNWQKVLIGGTANWTNINGNLSGGNANTQFLIGGGYNRQTLVYPGDYSDAKKSVHLSITNTSDNQKFHAQFSASYVNDDNNIASGDLTSTALTLAPDAPTLYRPDGSINWQIHNGTATFVNPVAGLLSSVNSVVNNLVSNLDLSYQLFPGLVLKSAFGYNHDEMNETYISPDAVLAPPANTNPNNRRIQFANTIFQSWSVEPQLSYDRKIAKGALTVLIGGSFQEQKQQSLTQRAQGFASDALILDPAAATTFGLIGDSYALYRYNAIYTRIGYNWEEKYLLNITARRDGSSRFGPDRQWGNFGAIGLGWIFSKEKFIENNLPWLNFGKLRGSYGITGSDQIANYEYLSTYSPNSTTYQGVSQLLPVNLPNPSYGWETDKKLETGLDLGFLKDRINLSLDYYRNRSSNQLVYEPLPDITGGRGVQVNLPATVQNTGIEAELHTINVKRNDFTWSTSFSFTLPKNKLVSFPGLAESSYSNYIIGQPLTIQRLWQYTGVNPQTGNYTFATKSPDGSLNYPDDLVPVNLGQKFYGGIQNSFAYKNFTLDIFIQFVKQTGYNWQESWNYPPGRVNINEPTLIANAWQTAGQITDVQKVSATFTNLSQYQNFLSSTGVITDDSFIRLKNVALSYRLPEAWQHWAGMQNAKFYIQGQNLYTFTKYVGLDPETGAMSLPPLRMITAGFSASF